jgi:hypothetical protein
MYADHPSSWDVTPTRAQFVLLVQLQGGDRVIVIKSGAGFELERAKLRFKKHECEP